jgi:hypothetical protein
MQKKTNQLLENRVRKIYKQIISESDNITDNNLELLLKTKNHVEFKRLLKKYGGYIKDQSTVPFGKSKATMYYFNYTPNDGVTSVFTHVIPN